MTGVSMCLRMWESKSGRARRLMRTDRFGIWAEEEEDTHHLRTPVSMETWPCSLWFSLLFLEGVSCTRQFICRRLKRWRNRVASSHFIYCSLLSNMMWKMGKKVSKLFESTRAHTHTHTQSLKQPWRKIKSGRLVSTHEFSIPLITEKKEPISRRSPWRSQHAVARSRSPEEVHKSFQSDLEGGSVIVELGADSMWEFGSRREFD